MKRLVFIASIVILHGPFFILSSIPLCANSSEDGSSTEFRENLLPAQQGDAKAQIFVAYLYETGQGVDQNYAKAAEWYRRAAEKGNATAQAQLGKMYYLGKGISQNYVLAYMWLDLAARQGHKKAQTMKEGVAKKMRFEQISEAKKMVRGWRTGTK
jgi:TPR repeat protein